MSQFHIHLVKFLNVHDKICIHTHICVYKYIDNIYNIYKSTKNTYNIYIYTYPNWLYRPDVSKTPKNSLAKSRRLVKSRRRLAKPHATGSNVGLKNTKK